MKLIFFILSISLIFCQGLGGWGKCVDIPQKILEFGKEELFKQDEKIQNLKKVECEVQIVAGTNYRLSFEAEVDGIIETRNIKIYEDMEGKLIAIPCTNHGPRRGGRGLGFRPRVEPAVEPFQMGRGRRGAPRVKRSMMGGWEKVDIERKDIQNVARFAIERLNEASNSLYTIDLHQVKAAYIQMVAGINYKITLGLNHIHPINNEIERTTEETVIVFQSLSDAQNGEFTSFKLLN